MRKQICCLIVFLLSIVTMQAVQGQEIPAFQARAVLNNILSTSKLPSPRTLAKSIPPRTFFQIRGTDLLMVFNLILADMWWCQPLKS